MLFKDCPFKVCNFSIKRPFYLDKKFIERSKQYSNYAGQHPDDSPYQFYCHCDDGNDRPDDQYDKYPAKETEKWL